MLRPSPSLKQAVIVLLVPLLVALGLWTYGLLTSKATLSAAQSEAASAVGAEADLRADLMERRFLVFDALHGLVRVIATGRVEWSDNEGPAYLAAVAEVKTDLARPLTQARAVFALDASGRMSWHSDERVRVGMSLADRQYFSMMVQGGLASFISDVEIGRNIKTPVVHYARALRDGGGRLVAVTVLGMNPASLVDMQPRIEGGRVGNSALFRADGVLLGSSAPEMPMPPAALFAEVAATGRVDARVVDGAGAQHLVALRKVHELGLVVAMSIDEATVGQRASMAQRMLAGNVLPLWGRIFLVYALALGLGVIWRHKRAEKVGRAEAERGLLRMTELAESLRDVVIMWEFDAVGRQRFTYVSPSCVTMLGIEAETLLADPSLLRYHTEDLPIRNERMERLLRNDLHLEPIQYRMFRADGAMIWVSVVSTPVLGFPGQSGQGRFVAVFRDMTALGESRRRLESLTTNSPVALYELRLRLLPDGGAELVEKFFTESASRITGYTMEELAGPGFLASVASPSFREDSRTFTQQVLTEGQAVFEYTVTTRSGNEVRVRDSGFLVRWESSVAIIAGVVVDVTVESRMRDQLQESSKLTFLGEMAAGIAHELHQPLAAIELHAETLSLEIPEATPGREKVLARVAKIAGLVERADAVIRRIRAFSRSDTAPAAPFDPLNAIDDALAIIERRVQAGQVRIRLRYPEEPVWVLGHEAPFEQVIMNLVSNAVDAYGPADGRDGPQREVTVLVTSTEGAVEIAVADQAGGIAADAMGRLFEPFFTTKPLGSGTGLGLSISYRIVRDMGGQIRAENRDGGAVFTVMLPVVPEGA